MALLTSLALEATAYVYAAMAYELTQAEIHVQSNNIPFCLSTLPSSGRITTVAKTITWHITVIGMTVDWVSLVGA